jgi:AcrR family transcriptional regulator
MEPRKTELIEAVGKIILESGINTLTIDELANKMEIPPSELSIYFEKDTDILKMMLVSLDIEIQELINTLVARNQSPEEELQNLFKDLYELFNREPYYLSLIFSTELTEMDSDLNDILLRIRTAAEMYLLQVIIRGKSEKIYKTKTNSRSLVNRILVSFRLLMNEQMVSINLVRNLKLLRSKNEKEYYENN